MRIVFIAALMFVASTVAFAQTTEFTYQGTLKDNGAPANANYDFEFALFDAPSAGSQIGSTIPKNNMLVTNGVFAVKLDFGSVFPGANRYLEIRVRQTGQPTFTTLSRQLINSSPYSLKSLNADNATNAANATNALQLGGVAADQYVVATGGNFNVSGNGMVGGTLSGNVVNASTQFNLGGNRMLSNGGNLNTLYIGYKAGAVDTGNGNTFVGGSTGEFNTLGGSNSFFGSSAGGHNTEGNFNTFIGNGAGVQNTKQANNTFVGLSAGFNNGNVNDAGFTANRNTFVGRDAGWGNETGYNNTFVGMASGDNNAGGINNSALGYFAYGSPNLINATSIGAYSFATQNNSLILGSISGVNNCTAANNCSSVNVGIGTTAPKSPLHLAGNSGSFAMTFTNAANTAGRRGYRLAFDNDRFTFQQADDNGNFSANQVAIDQATGNVGIGTTTLTSKLTVSGAGGIRASVNSDSNAGLGLTLNNAPKWSVATVSPGQFQIFNDAIGQNALWIDPTNNNVGIGSASPAAKLEVNGYTKLGSDAPSIRVKKLTGTTAATEGGFVDIPHGLDGSKILSISVLVLDANGDWEPANYTSSNGYHFQWYLYHQGSIEVKNMPGGSAQILSKPIKILITYEQ